VLWFSDLVDFTKLADILPREQLIDLLPMPTAWSVSFTTVAVRC